MYGRVACIEVLVLAGDLDDPLPPISFGQFFDILNDIFSSREVSVDELRDLFETYIDTNQTISAEAFSKVLKSLETEEGIWRH